MCTGLQGQAAKDAVYHQDLRRVVIGHVSWHLMDPGYRKTMLEWMKRGANFMPTNLDVRKPENWRLLIEAIHQAFDAGYGSLDNYLRDGLGIGQAERAALRELYLET